MTDFTPFAARPLDPGHRDEALRLAAGAGVHGVYIANVLHAGDAGAPGGEVLALHGVDGLVGLAYFGPRGNLLVLQAADLDPGRVAEEILDAMWSWRIVLAPAPVVRELVRRGSLRPLVDRRQIYYGVTATALRPCPLDDEVRPAARKDLRPLMEASLHLNETDLSVDRWRVDRDWLKRNTRERIARAWTFVVGPPGAPVAKLDFGSVGPAGVVIEGVYTWPRERGRGLAAGLVAAVAARALADHPMVCLHVAADNAPARRAYEKCGMTEMGECRLMLRE